MKKGYLALVLSESAREDICWLYGPKHENFIGHHVTLEFGIDQPEILIQPKKVEIVGRTFDEGVEAFVVSIDGSTKRKDGGTYHLTWSLANGHKPFESNKLIEKGFVPINPIALETSIGFIFFKEY